ncbi:hypothetical protein HZA96_01355 [Candidatus Woesearchaeota archaeon]|nr:hypothetical protein [Candidatus Woesearchaeota archaeon]
MTYLEKHMAVVIKQKKSRKWKAFLGILLILAGIIGWVLPFVPGTPFIIAGLLLLHVNCVIRLVRKYGCKYGFVKQCVELTE